MPPAPVTDRTNHHTEYAEITVTIGGLRFIVELREANTLFTHADLNSAPAGWDVQFVVRIWDDAANGGPGAFVLVTDCDDLNYADITSKLVWENPSAAQQSQRPLDGGLLRLHGNHRGRWAYCVATDFTSLTSMLALVKHIY